MLWRLSLWSNLFGTIIIAVNLSQNKITLFGKGLIQELKEDDSDIEKYLSSAVTYFAQLWLVGFHKFISRVNDQMGTSFEVDELQSRSLPRRYASPL
ncbi:hypothetical protein [Teredinibacter turnerae]|uniref:hypothetical protein n=1 Tax=Teredinibacter turnerae TaxID=2426 RepID=UPI0012BC68F8|nr:hypothetical protein [Teredinibacter turnerae]